MAEERDDDELLLEDELEVTDPPGDTDEEGGDPDDDADGEGGEDEETVITFGEEDPDAAAKPETNLVKHLREELRKRDKDLAEARRSVPRPQPIEVGEKPTLAGCEYDEDAYEAEMEAWNGRKAEAERAETNQQQAQQRETDAWAAELKRYEDGKTGLGFADIADAEETVKASLNLVQQAVLVKAADNPALVLYSLAKHPDRLAELAKIADPLKLAAAIARLEGTLKMTKRRKAPDPETVERGSGSIAGKDKTLERLEKEADAPGGDRTKLIAYKRKLKDKAKAKD